MRRADRHRTGLDGERDGLRFTWGDLAATLLIAAAGTAAAWAIALLLAGT